MKQKKCDGCEKLKPIWKNLTGEDGVRRRLCKSCFAGVANRPGVTKKTAPPRLRSQKRETEEKEYSVLRRTFLEQNPMCQAHLAGCQQHASEVHHKAGRVGKNYLDITKWLASCRPCHQWIETHPKEARAMGLSLSKY